MWLLAPRRKRSLEGVGGLKVGVVEGFGEVPVLLDADEFQLASVYCDDEDWIDDGRS